MITKFPVILKQSQKSIVYLFFRFDLRICVCVWYQEHNPGAFYR